MLVKVFSKSGSCKSCIDYLSNKEDGKSKLLKGNPNLTQKISDGLDFANTYTAGCLSFEEENISDEHKREIMEKFEESFFSGLDEEQYNITWIEHTDKDRLELNFVIPNVEVTSGKRLQPYYDKADRPLAENFKQIINHEYGLSDPNNPEKSQSLITKNKLPEAKKEALEAINSGIQALVEGGQVNNRTDVVGALEGAGFEIARTTPKNISIKTDGQNLRLKGAFYDENFRGGESLRETITERSQQYERRREERYQTARKRLDSAVSNREREFSKRYPNRAKQIGEEITKDFQSSINRGDIDTSVTGRRHIDLGENGIQQNERVETVSRALRKNEQFNEDKQMPGESREPVLHRDRPETQGEILGRKKQPSHITNNSGVTNDGKRETIKQRVKRIGGKVREKYDRFRTRIESFTKRKRLDNQDVQGDNETKRGNQQSIKELDRVSQSLALIASEKEKQSKKIRANMDKGQDLSR